MPGAAAPGKYVRDLVWFVSVDHNHEPHYNGRTDQDAVRVGPWNHIFGGGWIHLGASPAHCKVHV